MARVPSNTFQIQVNIPGNTALALAAAALGPGDSVNFTPNTLQDPRDIQWSLRTIFYDSVRKELQYMGKPASGQSMNHAHYIYEEASDTWRATGTELFVGLGHIWDATFDPLEGDYLFRTFNSNRIERYDRSEGVWISSPQQTSPALNGGSSTIFGAMGWHPNLFGTGNPGIFCWSAFRFFAFRPSDNSWHVLNPSSFPSNSIYFNRSRGQAIYIPATDQLLCLCKSSGNGNNSILIDAGAGLSTDVIADNLVHVAGVTPIPIDGAGGTTLHGHATPHPSDPNRVLITDEHASGQVWDSTDFGQTWNLKSYLHPFTPSGKITVDEYTVGTIPDYGVVIGMTSHFSGGETVLWKPGD